MNYLRKFAVVAALLAGSQVAMAVPVDVVIDADDTSVDLTITGCFGFCDAGRSLASSLDGFQGSVDNGGSLTFDFFEVYVGGLGIGSVIIEASLAFISPEIFSAVGDGAGGFLSIFGEISGGVLTWDQPDSIVLSDGSTLSIMFEDIKEGGLGNSTMISATVSRSGGGGSCGGVIDPFSPNGGGCTTAVPEPGTLALFGIGLLILGFAQGRSRRIG